MKNIFEDGRVRRAIRITGLLLADIFLANLSQFFALFLRYELSFRQLDMSGIWMEVARLAPVNTLICVLIFALFGLYSSLWSFIGSREVFQVVGASIIAALFEHLCFTLADAAVPKSFPILNMVFMMILLVIPRLGLHFLNRARHVLRRSGEPLVRTMLIGGGDAGMMLIKELARSDSSRNRIVCIIDDDKIKKGMRISRIPIVGDRNDILTAVKKYRPAEIIFAIPTCPPSERREILSICQQTGLPVRILPGLSQLASGEVTTSRLRKVEIEDLLGRDSVKVNMDEIGTHIEGKTVLVTGGGGSIGSELCRQIASRNPGRLIIFDIYENNAYAIQQELKRRYKDALPLTVLIGSVRDKARVEQVFDLYHPDIVYHAAAHKHVPLMEISPCESIKNNAFGTFNVADAANRHRVSTFVLISTDKAVNPTNVMGASKRVCEMIVQMFARKSADTRFVAVRFGNVLGSNGSVIPLFRKQLEEGGPLTVTHKDIIRYFMTIPEAVSLVMQAGVYAKGGEIFVLDMGDPVRIDDLARNMIKLSGLKPDEDIQIVYTGLRPGEKLYEELLMSEEGLDKTSNSLIFIGHPAAVEEDVLMDALRRLKTFTDANDSEGIVHELERVVTTYHPQRDGVTNS